MTSHFLNGSRLCGLSHAVTPAIPQKARNITSPPSSGRGFWWIVRDDDRDMIRQCDISPINSGVRLMAKTPAEKYESKRIFMCPNMWLALKKSSVFKAYLQGLFQVNKLR